MHTAIKEVNPVDGNKQKRRGRPRGSKSRQLPDVYVIPPECPKCGGLLSKDGSKLSGNYSKRITEQVGPLTLKDGKRYKDVQKTMRECLKCGQVTMVFEARSKIE